MTNKDNYIWIFGENKGLTANNNSYYFWKCVVNVKDDIDKYIVFDKNESTSAIYDSLSDYEKKFVVWKDSPQHIDLYYDADLFFVTLSYRDVVPTTCLDVNNFSIRRSIIYIGHGTTGIKKIEYHGTSYWNKMFRFLTYNPQELIDNNNFADYQILYAPYQPRYAELVRKDEKTDKNQILWFITWREYFEFESERDAFSKHVSEVLESDKLKDYLKENGLLLKLCVHQFFDEEIFEDIYKNQQKGLIEIVHSKDIDIMDELVKSKSLITDFSSIAYDFTLLERPVYLYQPDFEIFKETRGFYCDSEVLKANNITDVDELIEAIINGSNDLNPFFRDIFPDIIDREFIKSDKHIMELYENFADLQRNKVTVLGLNFYQHNDITTSIMSLVELLLYKGYLVDVFSLYRQERRFEQPQGLNLMLMTEDGLLTKKDKIKSKLAYKNENSDLKNDFYVNEFNQYAAFSIKKLLSDIRSKTVISTRESLHLFLNDCKSKHIKNKVYFFSSPNDCEEYSNPNLKNLNVEKSIFLCEDDIQFYEDKYGIKIEGPKFIFDSGITNQQILKPINLSSQFLDHDFKFNLMDTDDIDDEDLLDEYDLLKTLYPRIRKKYIGISFLSINKSNLDNLNKIIDFGLYLKENHIEDIQVNVVGYGDYIIEFLDRIIKNDLFNYIKYSKSNYNLINEIMKRDFILDLKPSPKNNIFCLQGVLNYKKVFCIENPKSEYIFDGIPNTFIESYDWLVNQIYNLHNINFKQLDENYQVVKQKYNSKREIDSQNLIKLLD